MTTFALDYLSAAWHLRYLILGIAALIWFADAWVKLNARLDAREAETRAEVATWHSDGRLTSVGGMEPGDWLAQAPRVRR